MAIGIGLALIGAGTVGNYVAGRQREDAFNSVLDDRTQAVAKFDSQRDAALNSFQQGLTSLSGQSAGNKVNALSGLVEAGGQTFNTAQAQGFEDIDAATANVFQEAPVGGDFAPQFGAGAGTLANMNAQMAPGQDALKALSAAGLGRQAQGQAEQGVREENLLANIGVQNSLAGLQSSNALRTADIGLRDLKNNLAFQRATQKAGEVGQNLQAFSGLAQQVGGGVLASGSTVKKT